MPNADGSSVKRERSFIQTMAEKRGNAKRSELKVISRRSISPTLRYGWAVGDKGLIATTDDGGRHWHLQDSGTLAMLRDVHFANSDEGCGSSERMPTYYTQRTAARRGSGMNTSASFHSAVFGLLPNAVAGLSAQMIGFSSQKTVAKRGVSRRTATRVNGTG